MRMGRDMFRRPHQRHLVAVDLVSSESEMSTLLLAQRGSLQGQVSHSHGQCRQAMLAGTERTSNQSKEFGEIVKTKQKTIGHFWM